MRRILWAALMVLAACGPKGPPPGTPYVEVSNTGSIHGADVLRIYQDEQVFTQIRDGGPETTSERWSRAAPGTFVTVAALVAADGPGVVARMEQEDAPCLDYGTSAVFAVPAIGLFAGAEASCPDPMLGTFMDELRAAILGG